MTILNTIEENPSKAIGVGATLFLASCSFGPSLLEPAQASGQEPTPAVAPIQQLTNADKPSFLFQEPSPGVVPLNQATLPKVTAKSVSVVRSDEEIASIWLPGVNVYVDQALTAKTISLEDLAKLNDTLSSAYPNWTVYLAARRNPTNAKMSMTQATVEARCKSVAEKLYTLKSFLEIKDSHSEKHSANILVVIIDQKDTTQGLSAVKIAESYRVNGLTKSYWDSHFAADFAKQVASKVNVSDVVVNSIQGFDQARIQRLEAKNAELAAIQREAANRIVELQNKAEKSLTNIASDLARIVPDYNPKLFAEHEQFVRDQFVAAHKALVTNHKGRGQLEVDRAFVRIAELKEASQGAEKVIKELDSYSNYVKEAPRSLFLDAEGKQAIETARMELSTLRDKVLEEILSPEKALLSIQEERSKLVSAIDADRYPELFAIHAGAIGGIMSLAALGLFAPSVLDSMKKKSIRMAAEKRESKHIEETTEKELVLVSQSLEEKRQLLHRLLIPEPAYVGPECEAGFHAEHLQEVAVQSWWILKKMRAVLDEAQSLTTKAKGSNFSAAHSLLHEEEIIINEDDGLYFLPELNKWHQKMALTEPLEYKPATTTFNKLSRQLIDHLKKAINLEKRIS
jgi:uncharacterized protein YeeX (DUF496 family)